LRIYTAISISSDCVASMISYILVFLSDAEIVAVSAALAKMNTSYT